MPVTAYVDGACSGNPGPAGYGIVISHERGTKEICHYLGQGTNEGAELNAVLRAAQEIEELGEHGTIYTDSQYTIGVSTKGWKIKANKELVRQIRVILARCPNITLEKVKGHSNIEGNEKADKLAVKAVRQGSMSEFYYL